MSKPFVIGCLSCIAALIFGSILVLKFGAEPPDWLERIEVIAAGSTAMSCGFVAMSLSASPSRSQGPVLGSVAVWLGVTLLWVPAELLMSAFLLGLGTRLLWIEAERLPPPGRLWPGRLKAPAVEVPANGRKAVRQVGPDSGNGGNDLMSIPRRPG